MRDKVRDSFGGITQENLEMANKQNRIDLPSNPPWPLAP